MKVLYLDYDDLKNSYAAGGQAYTASELTRRFMKRHEVTVVTGKYPGAVNEKKGNTQYVRLGIGGAGYMASLLSHWIFMPLYVFVNQNKYDVIVECLTGPFGASLVPFVSKKPLVAAVHFFDSKMMAAKYRLPFDRAQKVMLRKYKNFVVFTKELKEKVCKLNNKARIVVIPGGVGDELFKAKATDGDYILYLGRIDIFNKGLDLLLEALREIDVKLIVAGSGKDSEVAEFQSLVKKHGLKKRVKLVGRVSGKKKINLIAKSMFVVSPSKFETFGYVALEALAAGKMLVCFDIDGFKWIPNKCAVKVGSISARGLRLGLEEVLKSASLRRRAIVQNRKFAMRFRWDAIAQEYENELTKLA